MQSNGEVLSSSPEASIWDAIRSDHYAGYAYAYPHKTSYRPLLPTVALSDAWKDEDRTKLFLYVHLPFCEMRCGFCNLFTSSQPPEQLVQKTLAAIERQSKLVASAVEPEQIVQLAIGGGTPTYLEERELAQVLEMVYRDWPVTSKRIPFSVEVSPSTVTRQKLELLKAHGVRRISMGVQSFVRRDLRALGRPQDNAQVRQAIELIRNSQVEVFNLDLIYGSDGQTEADWGSTLDTALSYNPEELFVYPLYVRSLTGLGRTGRTPAENRRNFYLIARERLIAAGYDQISMRMFRKKSVSYNTQHCCQEDGLVGLGPGARSYTRRLHYSTDYAVSGHGVKRVIADFCRQSDQEMQVADYGFVLNQEEQARRYLIRSLLQVDGLARDAFRSNYGADALLRFPKLLELRQEGLADITDRRVFLTEEGVSYSDVIGPWLYSAAVNASMEAFELR